jgi:hypothetical protein
MTVTSDMLEAVMDKEEREKYLPALRKELATSHIIARQLQRLNAEQAENNRKISSLNLLTGGLPRRGSRDRKITYFDLQKDMQAHLTLNYRHTDPKVTPSMYDRYFAKEVHQQKPVSNEMLDQHALATVELVEVYANPDPTSFWLWAKFNGDYKTMIDTWAEQFGFVKQ